ncbi:MAG: hypothetical protein HKN75_07220 [Bacteroidia bacterium]|nr:hypothetical protein [Bacteroidia bacterium]
MKFKLVLILTFVSANTFAQDYFEVFSFGQKHFPATEFPKFPSESVNNDFYLNATLPIQTENGDAYLFGLFLEQFNTILTPYAESKNIFTIGLKFGSNINFNDKWSATFLGLPKLSSDLYDVFEEDFQMGFVVLTKLKKTDALNYKFGVYYNDDLFGTKIVPLIGLYRKSENGKITINASIPVSADLNYQLGKNIFAGTRFNATAKSYKIGKRPYLGRNTYLHKNNNEVKLYLQGRIGKNIIAEIHGGYTIGRDYELYALDDEMDVDFTLFKLGDDRQKLNRSFGDGFVQEFKLIYKVDL